MGNNKLGSDVITQRNNCRSNPLFGERRVDICILVHYIQHREQRVIPDNNHRLEEKPGLFLREPDNANNRGCIAQHSGFPAAIGVWGEGWICRDNISDFCSLPGHHYGHTTQVHRFYRQTIELPDINGDSRGVDKFDDYSVVERVPQG